MLRERRTVIIVLVMLLCGCCAVPGYLWWSGRLDNWIGDVRFPFRDQGEDLVVESGESSIEEQAKTTDPYAVPNPPTATAPAETMQVSTIFLPFGIVEITHGSGMSWITFNPYVYDNLLNPVAGADVTAALQYPDGSSQTMLGTTDTRGAAELVFEIFTYGGYLLRVEDIEADTMDYDTAMNFAREFPIEVTAQETQLTDLTQFNQFYGDFNQAFDSGDVDSLYASLHPEVIGVYDESMCRDYLETGVQTPLMVEVNDVLGFGDWEWEYDSQSMVIPGAYTLDVDVILPGGERTNQITHLALNPETMSLNWFTYCDANQ